jgi:drug/metabolite transporter (DMT)-like permease
MTDASPAPVAGHDSARQWGLIAQFVAMGVIWGASFLFMKVALTGVSFGQVAWSRLVLGGLTLGIIVLATRSRLPRSGVMWLHFTVIAISGAVIPHLLFAWGTQHVTSALASIFNAVTPITTALFATLAFRVERLNRGQILGVALGIIGVIVIVGPWVEGIGGSLLGQLACLGAVTCYGFTFGYTRKYISSSDVSGITAAFLQIGIAGVIMLGLTPWIATGPVELDVWVVGALLLLGALGTGVAYMWNMAVIRAWGPTSASTVTYITPVVGVVLGFLVLGETFSWHEPLGAVLVFLGILLAQNRLRRRTPALPA